MIKIAWDMPVSCSRCDGYEPGGYNKNYEPYEGACFLAKRCMMGHKVTQGRPSWCPLHPEDKAPEAEARCYLGSICQFQAPVSGGGR